MLALGQRKMFKKLSKTTSGEEIILSIGTEYCQLKYLLVTAFCTVEISKIRFRRHA